MAYYNFDKIIDRKNTSSLKWDALKERYGNADLLPLWVADMDFETPSFITEALAARLQHPIFGYTIEPEDYWPTVIKWIERHHQWQPKRRWLTYVPGVVKGIGMAINVFTRPGDKVIIQPPVYHPFRYTIEGNNRVVVNNPLIPTTDGIFDMDFDQLEQVIDDRCKMLILANPHNPGGCVWPVHTLQRLADICYDHHIIVVSDEIHCDMTLFGHKHVPFCTVSDKALHNSITFGAPTKTFNIAGIVSSYAIVPEDDLRVPFFKWIFANEMNDSNLFAPIATIAAYKNGEEWRRQMLNYIEKNIVFVENYFNQYIPQIRPIRPQASFLVWLDCRELGLSHQQLVSLFEDKAHLALNDGEIFGREGAGYMRLNVGTQQATLKQALDQLRNAIRGIGKTGF